MQDEFERHEELATGWRHLDCVELLQRLDLDEKSEKRGISLLDCFIPAIFTIGRIVCVSYKLILMTMPKLDSWDNRKVIVVGEPATCVADYG